MTSREIRQSFLDFFASKQHRIVPSAPVIPHGDPTLLFTNAGMNQFKEVFLGTGKRDYTRVADTQKCIRVSGKHNDLEEVGRDTYHHTFFEMLGNWSFGDYYKKEAIGWAWELLTEVWKLPKERLWATVYTTDDEAFELWKEVTDINPSHILKFGEKDNFWEMGETGPCGPCSEIHMDLTADGDATASLVNAGSPQIIEIWNLVFIQNNRTAKGQLENLPMKHVDTGMGFERVCAVIEAMKSNFKRPASNYDSDVFTPIIKCITDLTEKKYSHTLPTDPRSVWIDIDIAIRVIADHVRMLSFAIADGAVPSNKDRGYVLQQVLKRAARFGRILNMHDPFIYKIVDAVVESMGDAYPELYENQINIKSIIKAAEEKFSETEKNGFDYFYRNVVGEPIRNAYIKRGIIQKGWWVDNLKSDGNTLVFLSPDVSQEITANIREELKLLNISSINGEDAFKLHDTFGVHIDTTLALAKEIGISVDMEKYEQLMEEQRFRSRDFESLKQKFGEDSFVFAPVLIREPENVSSRFVGYEENNFKIKTEVIEAGPGWVILRDNPFYAQSGGQVSDLGKILRENNEDILVREVHKVWEVNIPRFDGVHDLRHGETVVAEIDKDRRLSTMRNHTATHLVHEALRRVLGTHLQQQGSLVAPDRLRFDFNHFAKISPDQLKAVEDMVNEKITDNIVVQALNDPKQWITIEEAKQRYPNVKMFFGDKYGDHVRIVEIDPKFSVELCGGTHVKNTGEIGFFKIRSEESSASGVRRIEAITYDYAVEYLKIQNKTYKERVEHGYQLIDEIQSLQKDIVRLSSGSSPLSKEDTLNLDIELRKMEQIPETPSVIVTAELSKDFSDLQHRFRRLEDYILMLAEKKKTFEKEFAKYNLKSASSDIDALIVKAVAVDGFKLVASRINAADMETLKSMGDTLRSKIGSGVGLLASIIDDKVALVCVVSDDLIKTRNIQAGKIVGAVARIVGGGGGGKPHLATAGGKDVAKLDEALRSVAAVVEGMI